MSDSLKYWALTLHLRPHQITQRHRAVVLAEDYDTLAARLAEAEATLRKIADHAVESPSQAAYWARAFLAVDSASGDIKPQYSEQFKRRVAEELEGFGDVVRARTAADQPTACVHEWQYRGVCEKCAVYDKAHDQRRRDYKPTTASKSEDAGK